MKKNTKLFSILCIAGVASTLLGTAIVSEESKRALNAAQVVAPAEISMPREFSIKSNTEAEIRDYYSALNALPSSERTGMNLAKNLKPILQNGMTYLSYDDIEKSACITERDWARSPENTIPGNIVRSGNDVRVTNYKPYKTSGGDDPLLWVLYRNDNSSHQIRMGSSHKPASGVGGIQKEHIWCQSRGFKAPNGAEGPAGTDMHHLIMADADVNQFAHNNHPYGTVDTIERQYEGGADSYIVGNYRGQNSKYGTTTFLPLAEHRGNIARAIFYMVARYNNLSGDGGITSYEANLAVTNDVYNSKNAENSTDTSPVNMSFLEYLLQWHHDDPVDEFEIRRNDLIYNGFQNNRNPFIDYPQWIDLIWGNKASQTYANPANDPLHGVGEPGGNTDTSEPGTSEPGTSEITPVKVNGVTLSKQSLSLTVNQTATLNYTISPTDADNKSVTWSSNNIQVATVSNGTVKGIKEGSAVITVKTSDGGYTAKCNVTVKKAAAEESFAITRTDFATVAGYGTEDAWSATTTDGSTVTGFADIATSNSYMQTGGNNSVSLFYNTTAIPGDISSITIYNNAKSTSLKTWTGYFSTNTACSPTSMGTAAGNTIQPALGGSATITIDPNLGYRYFYLDKTAGAVYIDKIVVTYRPEVITPTTPDPESVSISVPSLSMTVGDKTNLSATVSPTDAPQDIIWSVTPSNVVSISPTGEVTATGSGNATITATANGFNNVKSSINVDVINKPQSIIASPTTLNLTVGDTAKINATVSPSDAEQSLTWSVSPSNIVSVDKNGNVTANNKGSATVEISATNYPNVKTIIDVNVADKVITPTSITLSKNHLDLNLGDSQTITATVNPTGAPQSVIWESQNSGVASVSNGIVTAEGIGQTTITVKCVDYPNVFETITINVTDPNSGGTSEPGTSEPGTSEPGTSEPPVSGDVDTNGKWVVKGEPVLAADVTSGHYIIAQNTKNVPTSVSIFNGTLTTGALNPGVLVTDFDTNANAYSKYYVTLEVTGTGNSKTATICLGDPNSPNADYLGAPLAKKTDLTYAKSTQACSFNISPTVETFGNGNDTTGVLFSFGGRTLLMNDSDGFKYYADKYAGYKNYAGIRLYRTDSAFNFLKQCLETMTCADMANQQFINEINSYKSMLTAEENNLLATTNIKVSDGSTVTMLYALNRANYVYGRPGPSQLLLAKSEETKSYLALTSAIGLLLLSGVSLYFVKKKKEN